jgi:hypothetical protein
MGKTNLLNDAEALKSKHLCSGKMPPQNAQELSAATCSQLTSRQIDAHSTPPEELPIGWRGDGSGTRSRNCVEPYGSGGIPHPGRTAHAAAAGDGLIAASSVRLGGILADALTAAGAALLGTAFSP